MENLATLCVLAAIEMKYTFLRLKLKIEYFIEDYLIPIMYLASFSLLGYILMMGDKLSDIETIILNLIIMIFTITIFWKHWYDLNEHKKWYSLTKKQRKKILADASKRRQEVQEELERLS